MSSSPRRIIFDLTTSAQWGGPQGGIVQAERGLGRFAPLVAESPVSFSVYETARRAFFLLRPEVVEGILHGKLRIEFPKVRSTAPTDESVLTKARWVARNPGPYVRNKLSRYVGSAGPTRSAEESPHADRLIIPFEESVEGPAALSDSDVVLSCGSDWHGKDVFAILDDKRRRGFFYVSVCYDVIPWKHPSFWPQGVAESVIAYHAEASWLADLVMCISQTTAREYAAFCDELDLTCPRLEVFRLADDRFDTASAGPLPAEIEGSRYVLMVGSIEPRKNHRLMYEVWDELVREDSFPDDVKLVFAGAHQWMTDDLLDEIALNRWTRDRIVVLRWLSESELQALYQHCLFTVVPSFHEGWGLPVAESLSHGKVCIASNRGSLREISNLTLSLDVRDFTAWKRTVRQYVFDDAARMTLERLIRSEFKPRRWREAARDFFSSVEHAFAER
jgi:glycosyltransferase involved in cell wall biosynthesis